MAKTKRFQIGDYWLDQRPSGVWFRCWYNPQTGQVDRRTTGTKNLEQAKEALEAWYQIHSKLNNQSPEKIEIATILVRYWEEHGQKLRSRDQAKAGIKHWIGFYGDRAVDELRDVALQERFHAYLFAKGLKGGTVSRIITVGRAGIRRAYKRGELSHVPFIHDLPKADKQAENPRGRPMEVSEISRLFEATPSDTMRCYIIWLLATAARKEAVLDLTLERCNLEDRLVVLNPPTRRQTTKYRPTLRMPSVIVPMVRRLKAKYPSTTHLVGLKQTALGSPHESWNYARDKAGLDGLVNSYSMRHTISRELNRRQVPMYEIQSALGHKPRDLEITSVYAPYNPSYLKAASEAIDSFFELLLADCLPMRDFMDEFPNKANAP